eukprot:g4244.t1
MVKKKNDDEEYDDDFDMGEFRQKYILFDRLFFEVSKAVSSKHLRIEMSRFFIFIIVFLPFVIYQNSVTQSYACENTLRETFERAQFRSETGTLITFNDIDSLENFYNWAGQVLLPGLYTNTTSVTGPHSVKHYNELLWGVRFRQARVKAGDDCALPEAIKGAGLVDMTNCASDYSEITRETAAFGGIVKGKNESLYRWLPSSETGDVPLESDANINPLVYGGDGYVFDLNLNKTEANERLKWLKCTDDAYLEILKEPSVCVPFGDSQTRAIFVQFTTFNVNYDLFVRSEFRIEFSAAGWVETESSFYHGRLIERVSSTSSFVSFLNVVLCFIIVIDTAQYLSSLRRGISALTFWTLLDGIMYGIFVVHIYDAMRKNVFLDDQLKIVQALKSPNTFFNTSVMLVWHRTMQQLYAINTILLIIRTFKYLNLTSGLASVFRTLAMAMTDMIYFLILFFLMFTGFAFSGYVLFGPRSDDFKTLRSSAVTLLRMAIGDIEFQKFIEGDKQIAPAYFVVFTVLFYFIMTNIFLSIILDVWHKEKERLEAIHAKSENIQLTGDLKEMALKYIKTMLKPSTYLQVLDLLRNPKTLPKFLWKKICGKREDMSIEEIKERLKLWRNKRQNSDYNFVDFPLIVRALEGGHLNHKDVSDEQVQNVMAMCKPPVNTKIVYIYDKKQMEEKDAAMRKGQDSSPSMDEFAAKNIQLTSIKRLVQAVGMIHLNQKKFWGNITSSLEAVQQQSASMQHKLHTLNNNMDELVPKMGQAYGGRGLDDRNNPTS